MVNLKLVQLPGKIRALPTTDLASEDCRGGALDRPAERLLLLSSDRYEGLRNLSTFLRRQAGLFTESPPVSTRAG
jgi:hypothetical protein